jgi:hypothetical protein
MLSWHINNSIYYANNIANMATYIVLLLRYGFGGAPWSRLAWPGMQMFTSQPHTRWYRISRFPGQRAGVVDVTICSAQFRAEQKNAAPLIERGESYKYPHVQ